MKIRHSILALLFFLPGCADFESGSVDKPLGPSSAIADLQSSAPPDENAQVRARQAGPAMGVTQRSTAQEGSVVFHAQAAILPEDTNSYEDIYLRDGTEMILVSKAPDGASANNTSLAPCISADGQKVAFGSRASNLVAGDTNNDWDIFVYDRASDSITRVSTDAAGAQGTNRSVLPSMSADGTRVAFLSRSRFGTEKSTTTYEDVFLKDLTSGAITLISRNGTTPANFHSYDPVISGDGTKVAYASRASNLVAGDTNGRQDIFVCDTGSPGANTNITLGGNSHSYWPSISFDGSMVAFSSYANLAGDSGALRDIFVWNGSTLVRVGSGNNHAHQVAISDDGQTVAFASDSSNVVALDDNGKMDVFVCPATGGTVTRASVPSGVESNPGDSDLPGFSWRRPDLFWAHNTGFVTYRTQSGDFQQPATGEDKIVRRNLQSLISVVASSPEVESSTILRVSELATTEAHYDSRDPSVSSDGTTVAFWSYASNLIANDTNGTTPDIFVRDTVSGAITLVSTGVNGQGTSGSYLPSISADGTRVAFQSNADNLVSNDSNGATDIFVRDLASGTTTLISTGVNGQGNSNSELAAISADGTTVAFTSNATNLVTNDTNGQTDVFVRKLVTNTTTLISKGFAGQGNSSSDGPSSVSDDGRYVAFQSYASNLVANDTNDTSDVFIRDLVTGTTSLVSTGASMGNDYSSDPSISADGRYVAFQSYSSNLVPNDTNSAFDVFVRDVVMGTVELVSTGASGQGHSPSESPSISADGRYVAFVSYASNLVADDNNGAYDVFVRDRATSANKLLSTGSHGQANYSSYGPSISSDGTGVSFTSSANNLVSKDTNGSGDVFLALNSLFDRGNGGFEGSWAESSLVWTLFDQPGRVTGYLPTFGFNHYLTADVTSLGVASGGVLRINNWTGGRTVMDVVVTQMGGNQLRIEVVGTDGMDDLPINYTEVRTFEKLGP